MTKKASIHICDRCGSLMVEFQCKVSCPNCGCRFDCSDLTIHFDILEIPTTTPNKGQQHE